MYTHIMDELRWDNLCNLFNLYIGLWTEKLNQCAMSDTNKSGQLDIYAMWYGTEKLFEDEEKWSFS